MPLSVNATGSRACGRQMALAEPEDSGGARFKPRNEYAVGDKNTPTDPVTSPAAIGPLVFVIIVTIRPMVEYIA